jgi:hypothetical protein
MATFSVSKWFEIEAENIEEAYDIAKGIGDVVEFCEDFNCFDSVISTWRKWKNELF